ncbi:hypothetical protein PCASD_26045 [Puccinia coronata f. sp. avenae]|uniref:Uncharacterized protein n=1 Tax=Puccinia coronata f. sp. avenae TaxID=200324 RepID=A0A2N5TTC6_9BASI|nr:hypothetical protein PCASD_26045 [Puccinia coronata f. sp. avenae]
MATYKDVLGIYTRQRHLIKTTTPTAINFHPTKSHPDQTIREGSHRELLPFQRCCRPSTKKSSIFGPPSQDQISELKIYSLVLLWF